MTTPRRLPAGARPWLVASPAGTRLVLVSPGGPAAVLPLGCSAAPASDPEADAFIAAAPEAARTWWRLAAAGGFAAELWQIPNRAHAAVTDAWVLDVHDPAAGTVQRHAWVRASGGRWEPVPPSEHARTVPPGGDRPVLAERGFIDRTACGEAAGAGVLAGAGRADGAGPDGAGRAGAGLPDRSAAGGGAR